MTTRFQCVLSTVPLLVAVAFCAIWPAAAWAQSTTVEAEQLFRDGRRFMKEKKYAEACAAFQTSHDLDPALNTKLNLADCREKNGQLATAWGLFVDGERETRGDATKKALNKTAKDRAAALEPRLSYLTISVPDESRVAGLVILRNGVALDEGLWNRAVPVDGGAIVVAGRAPGHEEWSTVATVPNDSGRVSVEVPRFKEIKALIEGAQEEQPAAVVAPTRPELPATQVSHAAALTTRRKLGLGFAVVGVAALATGAVLGTQASAYESDALDLCPEPSTPCSDSEEATALSKRGSDRALLANVGFGVSAAAIGVATFLWITGAPEAVPVTTAIRPRVQPGFAGLDLAVRF